METGNLTGIQFCTCCGTSFNWSVLRTGLQIYSVQEIAKRDFLDRVRLWWSKTGLKAILPLVCRSCLLETVNLMRSTSFTTFTDYVSTPIHKSSSLNICIQQFVFQYFPLDINALGPKQVLLDHAHLTSLCWNNSAAAIISSTVKFFPLMSPFNLGNGLFEGINLLWRTGWMGKKLESHLVAVVTGTWDVWSDPWSWHSATP